MWSHFLGLWGLNFGVVPPICILVLSILWLFLIYVDIYSLSYIHFPCWTPIDVFVWNEIVHDISLQMVPSFRCILHTSRVIRGNVCISQDLLVLPVLLYCQWALEEWVVNLFNLLANSDVALSIICTVIDKTIFSTLRGKLKYVSYTTDWSMYQ